MECPNFFDLLSSPGSSWTFHRRSSTSVSFKIWTIRRRWRGAPSWGSMRAVLWTPSTRWWRTFMIRRRSRLCWSLWGKPMPSSTKWNPCTLRYKAIPWASWLFRSCWKMLSRSIINFFCFFFSESDPKRRDPRGSLRRPGRLFHRRGAGGLDQADGAALLAHHRSVPRGGLGQTVQLSRLRTGPSTHCWETTHCQRKKTGFLQTRTHYTTALLIPVLLNHVMSLFKPKTNLYIF